MQIRVGFEMLYEFVGRTPMVLMLNVHPSRAADIIRPDQLRIAPTLPVTRYTDAFGNICTRLVAPPGQLEIATDALVADSGLPDLVEPNARQHEVAELPHDVLVFLLASRYCETDRLMQDAWARFGKTPLGWPRVQAICDFVHSHVRFGYQHARATKTAAEVAVERRGVCRDFAHLAITLCRCMNIPARYCTGYLGDIGVPPEPEPMDFSAWFEAYLGGRWYSFDARHNIPRIGRIVMARGRDAADVAIRTTFGPNLLKRFAVHTDEVAPAAVELIERKVA
ncbi:MAG TPA: transglutaminase family protein [Xanthobacteraceae bacterium]